ncbi:hypothetical protein SEA_DIMINIMUS_7 [Mycobacterium phage Diminimus]|uniref:Uncharacterized protein n=6 Tax=Bongovirus bongo TaxID=1983750 RepID=A0A0M4S356_9CAUD|nr:hypothetical protein PEGLEG_6 [Mycobacterium phage PegLeg]YP_009604864.1 hypothetical protein FDH95_gp006 [Mycobacterium phage Bongo]ALF00534.1 hypothetical protein SEA_BRICOLE_6 [Mycobacterium phage Bricole]AXQ52647.1 hypothetical protein SEA_IPHANE7_6 [Mycobacterium phage IPhane7]QDH93580.1 hypothetical protein SEA_LILHOMIEP_6 [Mycobacterium phage LilhomieP]QGJ93153.1 hypothetical protein SEA_TYDAWG_6 [Mycobacterium phage TyDawg]QUU29207.1 hypothetical protein [Mycobacterium phage SirShe
MSNGLDRQGTERAFRTAINTLGYVRGHVTKLVDEDRTTPDLLNDIDDVTDALRADLETYRDWYREPERDT